MVINSHLHFDHAGGNTTRGADGAIRPTFPNARYVMQRGEYEYATHTNERTAASYFPHNFVPVAESGQLDFIDGERRDRAPAFAPIPTPGHTPHHQGLLIESDGERAFYIADLVPTVAHLPLPWIMGYDVEPLVTLETKRTDSDAGGGRGVARRLRARCDRRRGAGWRTTGRRTGSPLLDVNGLRA